MTTLPTLPIPRIPPAERPHEHAWLVESRHPTSDGLVLYVRCAGCPARRVDLQTDALMPPVRVSSEVRD